MNNFNPIQIISRITANAVTNYLTNNQNANALSAGGNNPVATFGNAMQSNTAYQGTIFTGSSFPVLSLASEMKLTTIEIEQKANYVKDLLNIPRDFSALLDEISSSALNNASQTMNQQLSQLFANGKINLTLLTALLNGNSKDAVQKLLMVISNVSKYGANDVSSLKELMNLLNLNSNVISENQALKNLMLLYLPWLPLSVRNEKDLDFKIDIHDKIAGPDPDEPTPMETVKVLIETINFKNVLGVLQMNEAGQVDIYINAQKDFPEKRALEMFNQDAKNSNTTPNIMIETKNNNLEDEGITVCDSNGSENNVQITSSNMVSPKLMLLAHSLIKIVIELDYSTSIIKERERSSNLDDKS